LFPKQPIIPYLAYINISSSKAGIIVRSLSFASPSCKPSCKPAGLSQSSRYMITEPVQQFRSRRSLIFSS